MDYQFYMDTAWQYLNYLPYMLVAYALFTLLPKSLVRITRQADKEYNANRHKFHRCYGPELCCHVHAQERPPKQKQRKPVTRVYPKRHQQQTKEEPVLIPTLKNNNVTKIARMFESVNTSRQVSRVIPMPLPEIRTFGASEESGETTPCASRKGSIATQLQHIEHAMQLWQEMEKEQQQQLQQNNSKISDWEPMVTPVTTLRRICGTSATPSTGSPLSSSPEPSSPLIMRRSPALCLKSSMEDIFQAIARSAEESDCNSLAPITCIDDILSERRFSRPLSAYSITDLLKEDQEEICVNETTLQQLETS